MLRHGPSAPALRALDAIHDRLESPDRTLRDRAVVELLVLPLFALCNAGVPLNPSVFGGRGSLAISRSRFGLVLGKPLGFLVAPAIAVWCGVAVKPAGYSWRQLLWRGRSLGHRVHHVAVHRRAQCRQPKDFAAARIAVFAASIVSALLGVALLWRPLAVAGPGHGQGRRDDVRTRRRGSSLAHPCAFVGSRSILPAW